MSEEMLIRHCSPTLAGLKTANLFGCHYATREEMCEDIRSLNRLLSPKGLRVIPLQFQNQRALIYIYRPALLEQDLASCESAALLKQEGYQTESCNRHLANLRRRLHEQNDFPHEIGLFLGYPPEDVRGFMENEAENCKAVGYWKVYGNVTKALDTFARFRQCTETYLQELARGASLERLAVAI